MENIITPLPENNNIQDDTHDEVVSSFLQLFEKYRIQKDRLDKIEEIEEDNGILEDLTARLPSADRPQVKPSMYFKLMRIYDVQASQMPKIKPVKEGAATVELNIVDAAKDVLFSDAGVDEVWYDVLQSFKAEGTAIVQLGYNEDGDLIPVERCQLAEVYFDASKSTIAADSEKKGRTIKTIIREITMTYSDAIDMYPELKGKLTVGAPATSEDFRDVKQATDDAIIQDDDKVTIHYSYSIQNSKKPIMAIYAGGSSTIVEKHEGKDYPFWRKMKNGKEVPFLPFIDFHFSSVKRGLYSVSMIGMMKDAGEAYRKILNASLPAFSRAVNPIVMLLGATEERTVEEMKLASELQDLGVNPTIAVGEENVRMQTVAPQGIFQEFEAARTVVFRDLAMRYDVNFQALEEQEQTATEFVGKTKSEIKAIAGLYTINKTAFNRLAEYITSLAARYWKNSDQRPMEIVVSEEDEDTIELKVSEAMITLKEWTGSFETEVDLRIPASTADKATAITEILAELGQLFNTIPFSTMEQATPFLDLLFEKISLRELNNAVSRAELLKMANSLIETRTQVQAPQDIPQQPQATEQNQDVAAELAPQSFLAESGLSA